MDGEPRAIHLGRSRVVLGVVPKNDPPVAVELWGRLVVVGALRRSSAGATAVSDAGADGRGQGPRRPRCRHDRDRYACCDDDELESEGEEIRGMFVTI